MKRTRRHGAATVEFAFVAPLFLMLVLGMIEFGRAIMVSETVNNAARSACRTASLVGGSNAQVTAAASSVCEIAGLTELTCTVTVNGVAADASTAQTGDTVGVTVSTPYNKASWLPVNSFFDGVNLRSRVVMRRE